MGERRGPLVPDDSKRRCFVVWATQPSQYLSHLIGHEGKGSILSLLKQKGNETAGPAPSPARSPARSPTRSPTRPPARPPEPATGYANGLTAGGSHGHRTFDIFKVTVELTQDGLRTCAVPRVLARC